MDLLHLQQNDPPAIMHGAGMSPVLAGGQRASTTDVVFASLQMQLVEQEQRYGNGEQPPMLVQQSQQPYTGPPLRYLLTGRQVNFCTTREDVLHHYQNVPEQRYWPVPEYAAILQGANGGGIVRARINYTGHAPSAITATVADRLGLQHSPLRRGGAVSSVMYQGSPTPLDVLNEPLTVQLLAGPGNVAMDITLPVVLVVPSASGAGRELFELQLGMFDFCEMVYFDWLPFWASQFTIKQSGYSCAIPVVAPPPPHVYMRLLGSSTFHITQDSYEEVLELTMARRAVQARRTAAAAAAAGDSDGPSPSDAAAEAMQQARHIGAGSTAVAAPAPAPALAAGTPEWIDEWAPAPRQQQRRQQQQQQQQRQRGRGGRRGRGRGNSRQQAPSASGEADRPGAAGTGRAAEEVAQAAAGTTTGVYAGLDPLPDGVVACLWPDVAGTSLPAGEDTCIICMDAFTDELEDGSLRLVTQLHCRHTHCVLCLRQYATSRTFHWRPLLCPRCRAEV